MNEHFLLQAVRPLFLVPFYLWQVILVLLFKINLLFMIFKKNIKQIVAQVVLGKQKPSGWKERDGFLEPVALAVSVLTCTYNLLSCSLACGPPDWELLGVVITVSPGPPWCPRPVRVLCTLPALS